MKKTITILLTLCLLITSISVFAVNANAEETALEKGKIYLSVDGNYEYTLVNIVEGENWISIKKYIGTEITGAYTVPDKIDGNRVVEIGEGCFAGQKLTSVTTKFVDERHELKIGKEAFKACTSLTSINLAKMTSQINSYAFMNCTALKTINENSVVQIDKGAFMNCSALEKVKFKSDYLKICSDAFRGCKKLKAADLSETVDIDENGIGFVNSKKVKDFVFNVHSSSIGNDRDDLYTVPEYAAENGFKVVYNMNTKLKSKLYLPSGVQMTVKADGKKITSCKSSNPKAVKITSKGKLSILNKGYAKITYTKSGKKYSRKILCNYAPKIDYKNIVVKKGAVSTETITIHGKVFSINNKYTKTKIAKIISKKSAGIIKVKGLKKGKTTLKIKVNGVKTIKLKVKVK